MLFLVIVVFSLKTILGYFLTDARSLFFDPLNPPKGHWSKLNWNSICKGQVHGCLKPVLFANQPVKSAVIDDGMYITNV